MLYDGDGGGHILKLTVYHADEITCEQVFVEGEMEMTREEWDGIFILPAAVWADGCGSCGAGSSPR